MSLPKDLLFQLRREPLHLVLERLAVAASRPLEGKKSRAGVSLDKSPKR